MTDPAERRPAADEPKTSQPFGRDPNGQEVGIHNIFVLTMLFLLELFALLAFTFGQGSTAGRLCAGLALVCIVGLFVGAYILDNRDWSPPKDEPTQATPRPTPAGLNPDDVDQILASMQEVTADTRNHLNMVLRARMTEKSNGL